MKAVVYAATSLDGYIADKNGSVDWLMEIPNPDNSDYGFLEFLESIDAIVMGRVTFDFVKTIPDWPYPVPVFILSNSIKTLPENFEGKVKILNGSPNDILKKLQLDGYNSVYIDGGKTIQQFLSAGLIDELIITRIPILLGEGIPLFGELKIPQKFEHVQTKIYNNSLVKSYYRYIK